VKRPNKKVTKVKKETAEVKANIFVKLRRTRGMAIRQKAWQIIAIC
jgi:hypothetical protein